MQLLKEKRMQDMQIPQRLAGTQGSRDSQNAMGTAT